MQKLKYIEGFLLTKFEQVQMQETKHIGFQTIPTRQSMYANPVFQVVPALG